jgi:DNA-binding NarL/FixJ family response regulator
VREKEVLELLVGGYKAAEVTQRFSVSLATVRTQIRGILRKLEVRSQLEAVDLARRYDPCRLARQAL